MIYELAFLQALVTTVLLEMIAAAALKYFFGRRLKITQKYPRYLVIVALASCLTLPYVWFILPAFIKTAALYIVVAEITVTVIEAAWYKFILQTSIKTAIIISIAANAFSYLIGNVLL